MTRSKSIGENSWLSRIRRCLNNRSDSDGSKIADSTPVAGETASHRAADVVDHSAGPDQSLLESREANTSVGLLFEALD